MSLESKIELKVTEISGSQENAYALLLDEVNGNRQLPIIIGSIEAQSIAFKLKELTPPRPFTHDLFLSVAQHFDIQLKEVLIYKAQEGIFYSYLCFEKEGEIEYVDSRTSDAVALALRFNCPIYASEAVMLAEAIFTLVITVSPPEKSEDKKDIESLKESLRRAIENEDYELASKLRDDIQAQEELS